MSIGSEIYVEANEVLVVYRSPESNLTTVELEMGNVFTTVDSVHDVADRVASAQLAGGK